MLLQKCSPFSTGLLITKKRRRWHVKNHYTFATRLLLPERSVQLQRWFWNSRRRMKKSGRKCKYLTGYTQRQVVIFNDCQFNWNNIYAKFSVLTIDSLIFEKPTMQSLFWADLIIGGNLRKTNSNRQWGSTSSCHSTYQQKKRKSIKNMVMSLAIQRNWRWLGSEKRQPNKNLNGYR